MKKLIFRLLCILSSAVILVLGVGIIPTKPAIADDSLGKMSSVYGYILNDYIETYGVMSTASDGIVRNGHDAPCANGVIYCDTVSFDDDGFPYLVIFAASGEYKTASCHVWKYNSELEKTERIAILEKHYDQIPAGSAGEFNIAWKDDNEYIVYNTYEENVLKSSEYYTVIGGEAFMYVNSPTGADMAGIMDFNSEYFHPGVDVSDYNKNLDIFFSKLKNNAASSVTYENILDRVKAEDRTELDRTLIRASLFSDLDILRCTDNDEYLWTLTNPTASDKFTQATALYDLGDDIYYALFDTTKSIYNYALLRKSDRADSGYQILKTRTDCIPLADRELGQIKLEYMNSPLLYEASGNDLSLNKKSKDTSDSGVSPEITVTVGDNSPVTVSPSGTYMTDEEEAPPKDDADNGNNDNSDSETEKATEKAINIEKRFDDRIKLPAACVGGGLAVGLLTVLWVMLGSDDEKQ